MTKSDIFGTLIAFTVIGGVVATFALIEIVRRPWSGYSNGMVCTILFVAFGVGSVYRDGIRELRRRDKPQIENSQHD